MLDLADAPAAFRPVEVKTLTAAYAYSLSYFDFAPSLVPEDRRFLAKLTLMAGRARRQRNKGLGSIVDAHALSAEIVDFFLTYNNSDLVADF